MGLKSVPALRGMQSRLGTLAAALPLSPAQITASSVLFAAAGLYFSLQSLPIHSLAFFILAGAADALDGAVARAKKQVSASGAYIDGICDRLVEFLLVLALLSYSLPAFLLPSQLSLICILFFGSTMSSFATAYAEHRHVADAKKISCQPGILPRAERLILLFAALATIPFAPQLSSAILFAAAALSFVTFAQRFAYFAS